MTANTDPATLTRLLVDVYARLRRGELTDSAARREASGYFASLRELATKAGDRAGAVEKKTVVEFCYIPGDYADDSLERLTPDFRPWGEQEEQAREAGVTPEDVELLEVNGRARARRGEVDERTAKTEAFILKAIRLGLTLAPVAGSMTWGDLTRGHAEEPGTITVFSGVPDEAAPITGPVLTFVHGLGIRGQEEGQSEAPPWPIMYMGKVSGYYVPKGWTKPEEAGA